MKFPVIACDPPWHFELWGEGTARHVGHKYQTQDTDWLAQLPVSQIAADDCVLLMWSVWPRLPDALKVIDAWGFTYKTAAFTWIKKTSCNLPRMNLGYWTRANSEPCLLATRGKPKRMDKGVSQVIVSGLGEHSEKPTEFHDRIERLLEGPYCELFARRRRERWTCLGNEIDGLDITESIKLVSEDKELPVIHRDHPSLFDPAIL